MLLRRSFSRMFSLLGVSLVLSAATAQALTTQASFVLNSGSTLNATLSASGSSVTHTASLAGNFLANLDVLIDPSTFAATINTMGLYPQGPELPPSYTTTIPGNITMSSLNFAVGNVVANTSSLVADFKTVGLQGSQFAYGTDYENMTVTGTSVPVATSSLADVAVFNGGTVNATWDSIPVYSATLAPGHTNDIEGAFGGTSNGTITVGTLTVSGNHRTYGLTLALPVAFSDNLTLATLTCSGTLNATSSFSLTAMSGDADLNGIVNGADLNTVLSNYNKTGLDWSHGDFDGNGTVNGADLNFVLSNYNKTGWSAMAAVAAVAAPEPASIVLLATLLPVAGWLIRRRIRAA